MEIQREREVKHWNWERKCYEGNLFFYAIKRKCVKCIFQFNFIGKLPEILLFLSSVEEILFCSFYIEKNFILFFLLWKKFYSVPFIVEGILFCSFYIERNFILFFLLWKEFYSVPFMLERFLFCFFHYGRNFILFPP